MRQQQEKNTGKKPFTTVLLLIASLAVCVAIFEFTIRVLVNNGTIAIPPPMAVDDLFYNGTHPVFGVWRYPNARALQWSPCFQVENRSNDDGARDRDRQRHSNPHRVVVLGDSFVEGWGLPVNERVSDLLENATGIEHLNFAMAHFSPYQSYLVYRDLAKKYDHDHVLIGITVVNDFIDLDFEAARNALSYEYRYRPYPVGEYPNYHYYNYRESDLQRYFRRNFYAYNAINLAWHRLRGLADSEYDVPQRNEYGTYLSYYYDSSEKQFNLLRYSLELLLREADGKRITVFLIPAQRDFARYEQEPGATALALRLNEFAAGRNLEIVDLLPQMYRSKRDWMGYFHTCDYHWNARGNALASKLLMDAQSGYYFSREQEK